MKRRTKLCGWSQFGAVALALLSSVACAARSSGTRTEVVGDLEWKYVAEGNGAAAVVSVAYANGDKQVRGTVTVPAAFEGGSLPVEGIGFRAFYRQALISEVVLPPRIAYLGNDSFHSCVRLSSVNLPPAVRKIGSSAFYGCSALKTVSLNAGLTTIGASAFGKCTSLESVALPATLTEVGDSAFAGSGLVQIAVPDGVKELGKSVFSSCDHLVSASIGRSVVVLPFRAFYRCGNLANVALADGALDTIGNDCFHSCVRLAAVKMPPAMRTVGASAFYGCSALKVVSLNAGLTKIADSAFGKCTSLESVALPATLTEVGDSAFAGSGLVQIVVPDGVKELGKSAFSSCDHLVSASIGRSVVVLPFRAFYRCGNLASVTVAEGALDTIGNDCFHSCQRLASLKMAKPLQEIKVGNNAFFGTPLDPQQGGRGRRGRR